MRWLRGITQSQLADKVGVRFQQIQKYENGANRVSASRLWELAEALDVAIAYFFEGLWSDANAREGSNRLDSGLLNAKETWELLGDYYAVNESSREHLRELIRALSSKGQAAENSDVPRSE